MQKITPFLWFDDQAEQAAKFYVSLFRDSRIIELSRGADGKVYSVTFALAGQEYIAFNGGPTYRFTPAVSLFVVCRNQREIDSLWTRLCRGGKPMQCGWVTDKFGMTWQIVPTILGELLGDEDAEKTGRVMQAMLKMVKLDVAALKQAAAERPPRPRKRKAAPSR